MEFDARCRRDNILFCKLMFIADRDSIAQTLGKRLAHKKICQDLRKWLDASAGDHEGQINREGLDEIEQHIDPTDFVAFNSYHTNLHKFLSFAHNTDLTHHESAWLNPWLVVCTSDRHPARVQLIDRFQQQFDRFCDQNEQVGFLTRLKRLFCFCSAESKSDLVSLNRFRLLRVLLLIVLMVALFYYYYVNAKFDYFD